MRGRKPIPTAIKLLRGNPGKRRLNTAEPVHPALDPTPPMELQRDELARLEWTRLVSSLAPGHMTCADRSLVVSYCRTWSVWLRLEEEADRHPLVSTGPSGTMMVNACLKASLRVTLLLVKICSELGITPSSRSASSRCRHRVRVILPTLRNSSSVGDDGMRRTQQEPPAAASVTDDRQVVLLQLLLEEVRGLRADLRQPRRRLSHERLLAVITTVVEDRAFCAVELLHHATVDQRLHQALMQAEIHTAKQLGRILARIEKRPVPGWRLERLTIEHDGGVWRLLQE